MQKFCLLVLLLITTFSLFSQDKTLSTQEIANKHLNSIVKVLLIDSVMEKQKPGKGYFGRGSGFFVTEDGLIFTNRHVVEYALGVVDYDNFDPETNTNVRTKEVYNPDIFSYDLYKINYISKMSIIVQVFDKLDENSNKINENSYSLYQAKLLSIDTSNYDGAILKIISTIDGKQVTNKFNPVIIGNSEVMEQGEDIYVYGFPAEYDGNFSSVLNEQSMMKSGKLGGKDKNLNKDYGHFKTEILINSGNSGGPVFNSRGEVIGIATAASNKTGNGFISKINGVYNLSKNDFYLQNALTLIGVQHTFTNTNTNGVTNASSVRLPGWERYNKYNLDQKFIRQFYGGFWFMKFGISAYSGDFFEIKNSPNEYITTNSNETYRINKNPAFFVDLGKTFSLFNYSEQSKLSIDWSFLNISSSSYDWTNTNILSDTNNSIIDYNTNQTLIRIGTKLGLSYSYLVKNRTQIDFYYKIGVYGLTSSSEVGKYEKDNNNKITYNEDFLYTNSFGINIHFSRLIFGVEYNYGTSIGAKFNGSLVPTIDNNFDKISVDGKSVHNNLNVCLAVPLYNKRRWQKIY
jgi:hypothetical protein